MNPVLVYGKYTLLDKNNPDVYAYTRESNSKKLLVLLNFKSVAASININEDLNNARLLLTNYAEKNSNGFSLRPYEARIYELKN